MDVELFGSWADVDARGALFSLISLSSSAVVRADSNIEYASCYARPLSLWLMA